MSEKTLRIVLGAVAVLVVLYAVTALASRAPSDGSAETDALAETLAGAWTDDVATVRILAQDDTITLERADGGWTVNGHPADSALVARFRDGLGDARVAHLAAANPANHARLGVSADSARVLEFLRPDGDGTRLLIGDRGPSYQSAYVRLPDRDEVYLVRGDLRGPAQRDADDWRDKTILRVDTAAVRRIAVSRDGEHYTLARDSAGWKLDGEPASAGAVRDLLGELARLEAVGFAPDSVVPAEPTRSVIALGEQGDTLADVSLSESEDANLLVTVPGRDAVFELSSWRADRLAPERSAVVEEDT
ncbi:MAG TPA: DUF4340 domain-containing protein [Longimicrobiales bacterium]